MTVTTRIEVEFSTAWIETYPQLAQMKIGQSVLDLVDREFEIEFDTSVEGYLTIIGYKP